MKILLLGANGQLGREFINQGGLASRGELTVASRDGALACGGNGEAIDLSAPESLPAQLDKLQPQLIVNAAAYTAVDRAENEPELAQRVNAEALTTIGQWAAANEALVLHYSTDYVFDGAQPQPYQVNAATAPLGVYGRSKLAGEQALRQSGAHHLIFRTAWVYAAHGHNFLRTMLRLGNEREELRVVSDQHGAPTDTQLIVRASLAALDTWQRAKHDQRQHLEGLHHLVASGATSWHGFAQAIFDQALDQGLIQRAPRVLPIPGSEFPTPAARPASSLLDNSGFQRQFDFPLPDWRVGLAEVITELTRIAGAPV